MYKIFLEECQQVVWDHHRGNSLLGKQFQLNSCYPQMVLPKHTQGLIQDFLLGGGKPYFSRNFGYFRTAEQTNSVIIILVIVYSSAIDQLKYSHFVCLPVYHIH